MAEEKPSLSFYIVFDAPTKTGQNSRWRADGTLPPIFRTAYIEEWAVRVLGDGQRPPRIKVTFEPAEEAPQ